MPILNRETETIKRKKFIQDTLDKMSEADKNEFIYRMSSKEKLFIFFQIYF